MFQRDAAEELLPSHGVKNATVIYTTAKGGHVFTRQNAEKAHLIVGDSVEACVMQYRLGRCRIIFIIYV